MYKDAGVIKDSERGKLEELTSKLQIMQSKLAQTKEEANQTRKSIMDAFKDRTKNAITGITKVGTSAVRTGIKISSLGLKLASVFASKTIGKAITGINNKLGNLKNKIFKLIGGAALISLFNGGLQKLKTTISSVLKVDNQFNSNLNQIRANLMTAFAPIYNAVLPALNSLMSMLSRVTGTIATFVSSLFGQSLKDSTKQAKKLSKALKDTAKSGDKARDSLASFDKLEVVGNDSSDSDDNSIDYNGAIKSNSQLLDLFNKIKDLLFSGDWAELAQLISEGFVKSLSFVENKIKSINWSEIGKGISDFLVNIDYSGILTGLISIFGESVLGFQELLFNIDFKTLSEKISTAIKDSFNKISEYIGKIDFAQLGEKISEAITNFDWEGTGISIIDTLWESLKGIGTLLANIDWNEVGKTLSNTINGMLQKLIVILADTDWSEIGKNIVDKIWNFITGIDWGELGKNILTGLVLGIKALNNLVISTFKELLNKILEFFGIHSPSTVFADIGKNIILGLENGLKSIMQKIIAVFIDIFNKSKIKTEEIITGIVEFIKKIPQKIASALTSVPEKFRQAFQKAYDKIKEIWNKVTSLFSKGGKIFDGLKEGIASSFKSIVNTLINGINQIIAIPFTKINNLLNNIRNCKIPGINIKPFEKLYSENPLPVPKIPKLAKGTVIPPRQEFMAILGDQRHGTNIEAPLETIKQANREVLDERDRIHNNSEKKTIIIERLEIPLECDKREIGRASYKGLKLLEIESGKYILLS